MTFIFIFDFHLVFHFGFFRMRFSRIDHCDNIWYDTNWQMHAKLLSKLFNENFWSVIPIKIVFKLVCLPWKKHILFFPRETFKVCWIKIYLAAATAFLRCHYFCCPSHFSYFSWLSVAYTLARITLVTKFSLSETITGGINY